MRATTRSDNTQVAPAVRLSSIAGRIAFLLVFSLFAFPRQSPAQQWYSHCPGCSQAGRGLASSGWLGPFSTRKACEDARATQVAIGWDFQPCKLVSGQSTEESSRPGCPPDCKSPEIGALKVGLLVGAGSALLADVIQNANETCDDSGNCTGGAKASTTAAWGIGGGVLAAAVTYVGLKQKKSQEIRTVPSPRFVPVVSPRWLGARIYW